MVFLIAQAEHMENTIDPQFQPTAVKLKFRRSDMLLACVDLDSLLPVYRIALKNDVEHRVTRLELVAGQIGGPVPRPPWEACVRRIPGHSSGGYDTP